MFSVPFSQIKDNLFMEDSEKEKNAFIHPFNKVFIKCLPCARCRFKHFKLNVSRRVPELTELFRRVRGLILAQTLWANLLSEAGWDTSHLGTSASSCIKLEKLSALNFYDFIL